MTTGPPQAFNHALMQRYLILCALAASAVCGAASAAASAQEQHKVVVATKPVSTRSVQTPQSSTPPRHLTDEERAELRRQLHQFNRQYGKRQ